jgi:hypothetical protein
LFSQLAESFLCQRNGLSDADRVDELRIVLRKMFISPGLRHPVGSSLSFRLMPFEMPACETILCEKFVPQEAEFALDGLR